MTTEILLQTLASGVLIGLIYALVAIGLTMQTLPALHTDEVMDWVASLPYPWCPASVALPGAPDIEHLAPVLRYIDRTQKAGLPDGRPRPAASRSAAASQA